MLKYEKGNIISGIVSGIEPYGVFVTFDNEYTGLVHISEISHRYVKDIHDFVKIGEEIHLEVLDVDEEKKHLKLSMKSLICNSGNYTKKRMIVETKHGFSTLAYKLPFWIDENLKNSKNKENSIDK